MKFSDYKYPTKYDAPYAHQIEMVKFHLANPRGFNLSEMGTGKTLSILWTLDILRTFGKIKSALLVVPISSIELVWVQHVLEHMPHLPFCVLHKPTKTARLNELAKNKFIYIINHDGLRVLERELIRKRFDVVMIDELTTFKSWKTDRTKVAHNVCNQPYIKAVWGLTGSATDDSPLDAYGQAKVVRPNNPDLPKYFKQFRDEIMTQLNTYTEVPKPGWELTVAKILSPAIRFKLRDCVDLPPTIYEDRSAEMSPEQKRLYDEMFKQLVTEYEGGIITASNAGVKVLKLLQISAGTVYDEDRLIRSVDCKPKLKVVEEILHEVAGQKIIIFAEFKAAVEMVNQHFNDKGIKSAYVHGGINPRARPDIYSNFIKGDTRVLVLQPNTSAHALTLTAASVIVWYTPITSGEKFIQANSRIIRPGQERTQLIIRLSCSKAERHVYSCLDRKHDMARSLMTLFDSKHKL